jgi:FAD-dependent monooxygenase
LILSQLAAVINGNGAKGLLHSYELERRPVAFLSVEHSKVHMGVHNAVGDIIKSDPTSIDADTETGQYMRQKIDEHYQKNDGENQDLGIEMGYYYESPIIIKDNKTGPSWNARYYTPTTLPGARAPHVFLQDGTAIFDLYGKDYTLVDFLNRQDSGASFLVDTAALRLFPLKHLPLARENEAHKIWEKGLVLVRPDGHVAWRGDEIQNQAAAIDLLETITGNKEDIFTSGKGLAFGVSGSGTVTSQTDSFSLEKAGEFQQ